MAPGWEMTRLEATRSDYDTWNSITNFEILLIKMGTWFDLAWASDRQARLILLPAYSVCAIFVALSKSTRFSLRVLVASIMSNFRCRTRSNLTAWSVPKNTHCNLRAQHRPSLRAVGFIHAQEEAPEGCMTISRRLNGLIVDLPHLPTSPCPLSGGTPD